MSRLFRKSILIFILKIVFISYCSAQCCSVGIPTGGTTNLGILSEKTIRANLYYRFSKSDDYYNGDIKIPNGLVKNGKFEFIGYNIGYGISNRLLIEAEGGYFLNKSQEYEIDIIKSNGFTNHLVSLKYNIIDKFERGFELTLGGGLKFPFTTKPFAYRNVIVPYDLQPATGALGYAIHLFFNYDINDNAKLFLIHRAEINQQNDENYKYGEVFLTSVFISHRIIENLTGILQLRNEIKAKDKLQDKLMPNSGGYLLFLCPQLNYNIDALNITAIFDYPVYKYYNGKQLSNNFSIALNLSYIFSLN